MTELIFGPVPSRRLGKSIGINNIPHKVCSYSCAYCQVGKGDKIKIERQEFYKPDVLFKQAEQQLSNISHQDYPDYITIVPDGEPTLDTNLGALIVKLKQLGLPVAVITNASLFSLESVKKDLLYADYISAKVDTVCTKTWKRINKPHKDLQLDQILNSLKIFAKNYAGKLVTETMLVKNINDSEQELSNIAEYIQQIKPYRAYISIPTRPPAFTGIHPSDETALLKAYEIFNWHCLNAEYLTGYEGNSFASTNSFAEDLLSITAVHPMRIDAVKSLMLKTNTGENALNQLIENNLVKKVTYDRQIFYVRTFKA